MKITNSEIIKTGERELMDAIVADLDWKTIEDIFRTNHDLEIQEDVEYKNGDMVVHDGDIAYELDFEVKVTLSILMDRGGNFLSVKSRRPGNSGPVRESRDEAGAQGYEEALTALGSDAENEGAGSGPDHP
jgi:hypothetical protein